MTPNRLTDSIKAIGRIEGFKSDAEMLRGTIERAPLWRPGAVLRKQCDEVFRMIGDLGERFERKLVVTIIGPCGSGKSTLLNALAGVDDLSKTGHQRPTTKNVVVLCRETGDADPLKERLGSENVSIRSSTAASSLEHVILIDTPDTDSTEHEKHIPMVQNAISNSDILLCVFDSENPKRRDHVDFLAPYVRLFNGESVVGVINKSDRQDERELKEKILPEFEAFIKAAWEQEVHTVLCISARSHLRDPKWDPKASPRHDFDRFRELREMIFGTFNRPGYVVDRRLQNAKSLRDYIFQETRAEVERHAEMLAGAREQITTTENEAVSEALSAFQSENSRQPLGVNVLLYQKLAQKWLGPVGWLVAVWGRALIFATGVAAMFRFGSPLRRLSGMASSLKHFKASPADLFETERNQIVGSALRNYRMAVMKNWPDIGETLVKCGYDPSVRKIESVLPDRDAFSEKLSAVWRDSLDHTIENTTRALSGVMLQVVFNLPVIGILGHVGWTTAREYFSGNYLSSNFFFHAFLAIGITLFLSFFVFQVCVRLVAGTDRAQRKILEQMKRRAEELHPLSIHPVSEQIDVVLGLARMFDEE